jgi:hypothetical protein
VLVEPGGHAGGTGQEMLTREARLGFRFGSTWPGVTLLYAESAQPVNLRVGADLKVVPDLMSLNGQTVGGVQVSVAPGASPNQGVLTLNGPVDSFALGAEHLYIDHVCPAGSGTNVTVLGLKMVPMITVTGAPGSSQDVQYREALEPGEIWHPWTTVVLGATGSAVCFDTNAPAGGKRFYRSLQRLAP